MRQIIEKEAHLTGMQLGLAAAKITQEQFRRGLEVEPEPGALRSARRRKG